MGNCRIRLEKCFQTSLTLRFLTETGSVLCLDVGPIIPDVDMWLIPANVIYMHLCIYVWDRLTPVGVLSTGMGVTKTRTP